MSGRWALFGGTFDPVHNAHVALARVALDALALDEVRWVPAGQPWQKPGALTPALHREAMVRLAIAGEPRFVLDRIELERQGPSYTVDTVRELQAARPGTTCFLLIGGDQLARLHTWRDWPGLLQRVTLAVAERPGAFEAPHADVERAARSRVPLPPMDLSSTDIRRRAAAGQDISQLVPPEVARYIDLHRLYAAATGS